MKIRVYKEYEHKVKSINLNLKIKILTNDNGDYAFRLSHYFRAGNAASYYYPSNDTQKSIASLKRTLNEYLTLIDCLNIVDIKENKDF